MVGLISFIFLISFSIIIVDSQSNPRSRVFTVGDNVYGQLAAPSSEGSRSSPIPLTDASFNGENIIKGLNFNFNKK